MNKKKWTWVEQSAVITALRRIFRTYPPYQEVRNRCKVEWFEQCKNGNTRRRVSFKCETCTVNVTPLEFVVDHTEPVVNVETGFVDYNTYVKRLFCPINNLSGMCKTCHNAKSLLENRSRREHSKRRSKANE